MVHPVDDRARAQKQHRLEKRVGQQVEHGDRVDTHARGHEHIAQLRAGRIGNHTFDVVLHKAHGGGKERRQRADIDDKHLGLWCEFKERRHPANQKHARGHHGGGVDQGGHRRWAFHRVGQPGVQKELRRFAHRADEQQEGQKVGGVPIGPQEPD